MYKKATTIYQGLTMIETIITIAIISLVMIGFTALFARLWKVYGFTMETGIATQIASRGIDDAIKYIRKMQPSENGSFPIVSAKPNDFVFYSDYDNDGIVERVHYFGGADVLKVGITEPDTSTLPANYDDATESIEVVSRYVVNDIIQGSTSCTKYVFSSEIDGTPSHPFTSIGMARNVGSAGGYDFSIDGQSFHTQVTSDGWVLVASGEGSDTESRYNQVSNLSYRKDNILASTILSNLSDITHVRIQATSGPARPFDVTTDNADVITRLKAFKTLGYDITHNNIAWQGDTDHRMDGITCNGGEGALNKKIYHACGNNDGMYWTPGNGNGTDPSGNSVNHREQVQYSAESCWWWWCSPAENNLNLYVNAPADPSVFYVTATKQQPNGFFLGDNGITYTEQDLLALGAFCTEADSGPPEYRPIFEYYDDFREVFDALEEEETFGYENVAPTKLIPSTPGESVDVTKVKMVKVLLHINPEPNQAPDNIILESFVNLRNLSPYDHL